MLYLQYFTPGIAIMCHDCPIRKKWDLKYISRNWTWARGRVVPGHLRLKWILKVPKWKTNVPRTQSSENARRIFSMHEEKNTCNAPAFDKYVNNPCISKYITRLPCMFSIKTILYLLTELPIVKRKKQCTSAHKLDFKIKKNQKNTKLHCTIF